MLKKNRNFGDLLNIWDKIFGTHLEPRKEAKFNFGISNNKDFDRDIYFSEIFQVLFRWLKFNK